MNQMTLAITVALLAACGGSDPYAEKFASHLAIGDSRSHAVEVMGLPSTVSSIEVPLLRLEQIAWKTTNGRVYVIHIAMDRVISKSVIQ